MKGNQRIIIGALILLAMVSHSNAYYFEFADSSPENVVQLYFEEKEVVQLASAFGSNNAAKHLIDFAKGYGRDVSRNRTVIADDISGHALEWIAGKKDQSNPMDIALN